MTLVIKNHRFRYEMENLCRMFFPAEKITVAEELPLAGEEYLLTELCGEEGEQQIHLEVYLEEQPIVKWESVQGDGLDPKETERQMACALYPMLQKVTGLCPPWGILTGIRPVKLFEQELEKGKSEEEIRQHFAERQLVSEEKISLALATAYVQREILYQGMRDDYSLYISIPFCPSRCGYCSFVSQSVERMAGMIGPYVEQLCCELAETAKIADSLGLRLSTVYIGGGTPTTLSPEQMKRVTDTLYRCFDMENIREFTVEAGRPDTITEEKLAGLLEAKVSRISINPQTLQDAVLEKIGRRHSAACAIEQFSLARTMGFDNINMDLIAGLPGDTLAGYRDTLDQVLALAPENITVHTLSVKRAADLGGERRAEILRQVDDVQGMLFYTQQQMQKKGYRPYYLYRQKNTMGNMENVGYAQPNKEGLYNILIMDEMQTILACGAGAVTKLVDQSKGYIERVFNYKYPGEYLKGFDNILSRKGQVKTFYDKVRKERGQKGRNEHD